MKKIMAIVGLGETRKYYREIPGILSIGINDIFRYIKTTYLLVTDHPCKIKHIPGYNDDRLDVFDVIRSSRPEIFYSPEEAYSDIPNFVRIRTIPLKKEYMAGNLLTLDNKHSLPFSTNSPFTAVCLAWSWYHPERIIMYGVDFLSHSHNNLALIEKTLYDYQILYQELKNRGCELATFSNESLLACVMPSIEQKLKTYHIFEKAIHDNQERILQEINK